MRTKTGIWIVFVLVFFASCEEESYIPKPKGFFRIDFPEHQYQKAETSDCPFTFEIGSLARIETVQAKGGQKCWFNLVYPSVKSTVHFSYYDISNRNVNELIEDSRKLAVEHLAMADDFEESVISDPTQKVYGMIYDFEGNTASNYQFYLTDSTNHFVRGALYFRVLPNADSLAPAEKYIEEELLHLVSTFKWN